jgi:hypothetical protein
MGHHKCSYVDYDTALKIGVSAGLASEEVKEAYFSSCETILEFASGNNWMFPDMLPLYVALGYRPDQPFVDDVVSGTLTGLSMIGSAGIQPSNSGNVFSAYGIKGVGYLQGEPLPLQPDPSFSKAFIARLKEVIEQGKAIPSPPSALRRSDIPDFDF